MNGNIGNKIKLIIAAVIATAIIAVVITSAAAPAASPIAASAVSPLVAPTALPAASQAISPVTAPAVSPAATPSATPAVSPAASTIAAPAVSPAVTPAASQVWADRLSDEELIELNDMLGGFNPDAKFGGLGFDRETGPGHVSIGAIDTDGDYIDGIDITINGFRTGKFTSGGVPYTDENIPYGERVYGIYLTYSFSIDAVRMTKYAETGGGMPAAIPVVITDFDNLPPVVIADETVRWEITFVLRQYMDIKAGYYMVSPNDRFYFIQSNETAYYINTFEDAPVRVAVYIEMPALKNIRNIRVEGEGFGYPGAGAASGWYFENEYGDYILPDWTAVDRSCQLIAAVSAVNPGDARFIRFFILTLPSAYEGALLRFDRIVLTADDGTEIVFENPDQSALTVQIISAPAPL